MITCIPLNSLIIYYIPLNHHLYHLKRPDYPSDIIIFKRQVTVYWTIDTFINLGWTIDTLSKCCSIFYNGVN